MAEKQDVRVEIFDHVYHLRVNSDEDAEQIRQAAAYVDTKIRAVAANTRDVDSQRLAVLAALHIADELQALELRYNALAESVQKLDKRSNDLSRLLDGELELRNAS
jgi:cell division protein ZapA